MVSGAFNRVGGDYWTYERTPPGGKIFTTQGFGHRMIVETGPSTMFTSTAC